ncbi:MAG: hypothetical protein JWO87_950 [Phycisphaerales bacterium]|nr:hypothetical protein [Phycisphaerales bacterium]
MTPIEQIQMQLGAANEQVRLLMKDYRSKAYADAEAEALGLERRLAEAKGEAYAVPLELPIRWDIGAPLPHVFVNDRRTFLTFYVKGPPDPKWDGSYVTVKKPGGGAAESLGLIEFTCCASAKLGSPNDEVFHGHYLHGRGQEPYEAQLVKNSPWIAELRNVNAVHGMFRPEGWDSLNHYVFWFHDSTFECVAEGYRVELHQTSMQDLAAEIIKRLFL